MTSSQKESITRFISEVNGALKKKPVDITKINSIVNHINSLSAEARNNFKEFYFELANRLFQENITLPSINLAIFDEEVNAKEKNAIHSADDFIDVFKSFYLVIQNDHKILRRFMLLKLSTSTKSKTKILLLHDYHSKNYLFEKISNQLNGICEEHNITDFINLLKKQPELSENTYLCVLLLSPNTSSFDSIQQLITDLREFFSNSSLLTQINYEKLDEEAPFYENSTPEEINKEIKSLIGIELINEEIDTNTAKAIKRLFLKTGGCHTLEYRILKGGFSGSKVILIQPHKDRGSQYKSVIKVNKRTDGKIEDEITNFYDNVDGIDREYTIEPEISEDTIAIKYPYASSDSLEESISFHDYYKNHSTEDCINVIDKLFKIKLFREWSDVRRKTMKASELYHEYINEERIFNTIKTILSKDDVDLRGEFDKIYNHEFFTHRKICHGDLHSENFFIEEKNNETKVYLIDFGHTKRDLHAPIDFATLEASIKFRHIPLYFDVDQLINIEEELLSPSSFEKGFAFQSIKRQDLEKPFKIINKIREQSNIYVHDNSTKIDYMISLLMITLRQIVYPNLFQLYALKSAKLLSNHIMNLLIKYKV